MKKGLLRVVFLLITICSMLLFQKSMAQQVTFNATNQFYYNPFDDSNLGVFNNYINGTTNKTVITAATTSAAFNGTVALTSVPNLNVQNNIWGSIIPSGVDRDLNNYDYEWTFLYKNNSNTSPVEPYDNGQKPGPGAGDAAWQYWLTANTNDHRSNGVQGFYITHVGGDMILRYRNSQYDIQSLITFSVTNNKLWTVKVQRLASGAWRIWANEVSGTNYEASTYRGLSSQAAFNNYAYSMLAVTDRRATGNNFYWDNLKLYTRRMTVNGLSSAANGITLPSYYPGQPNVVVMGIQVLTRGTYGINAVLFDNASSNGTNINAYFTNGRIVKSIDDNYATTSDNSPISTSSVQINTSPVQAYFNSGDYNSSSGDVDGSLTRVCDYFLMMDVLAIGNNFNYNNPPPYASYTFTGISKITTAEDNNNPPKNSYTYNSPSNGNNNVTFGSVFDWTAGSNTNAWGTPGNWKQNSGTATVAPGSSASDIVRIGVVQYTNGVQPALSANTTISNIQFGRLGSTSSTTSAGITLDLAGRNLTLSNGTVFDASASVTLNNSLSTTSVYTVTGTSGNSTMASTAYLYFGNSATNKITLTNSGTFILFSDASGSATIGTIPTGTTVGGTGNFNVQRYITANRAYRLLSSPVSATTSNTVYNLNYIKASSFVTGKDGTSGGFDASTRNNPTLYLYNGNVVASGTGFNSGNFKGIEKITAGSNAITVNGGTSLSGIPVGNGFMQFFVGNNTSNYSSKGNAVVTPETVTFGATGKLNYGDIPVTLWFGGTTLPYTTGTKYALVGNPYPSTINWLTNSMVPLSNGGITTTNVSSRIYLYNPLNKQYSYYESGTLAASYTDRGADGNGASNLIASGQAFFIKTTNTGGSITFKETAKVASNATTKQPSPVLMTTSLSSINQSSGRNEAAGIVRLRVEQDSVNQDNCVVYFHEGWTAKYDEDEDGIDLDGLSPTVYLSSYSSDGTRVALNKYPRLEGKLTTVPLYVFTSNTGVFNFKKTGLTGIPDIYTVWLKDKFKNDSLDITHNDNYAFNIDKANTATYGKDRFELVIRRNAINYALINFSGKRVNGQPKLTWKAQNEGDYTTFILEKQQEAGGKFVELYTKQGDASGQYDYTDFAASPGNNSYRLKQIDYDGNVIYSDIITVTGNTIFAVYPNPTSNQFRLMMTEVPKAPYHLNIYNTSGATLVHKTVTGTDWVEEVGNYLPGIYVVELKNIEDGKVIARTKFVKN